MEILTENDYTNFPIAEYMLNTNPMVYCNNQDRFLNDFILLENYRVKAYFAVKSEGLLNEENRVEIEDKIFGLLSEILSTMIQNEENMQNNHGVGVIKIDDAYFAQLLEKYFGIVSDKRFEEFNNTYWEDLHNMVCGTLSIAEELLCNLEFTSLNHEDVEKIQAAIDELKYAYSSTDTSFIEEAMTNLQEIIMLPHIEMCGNKGTSNRINFVSTRKQYPKN